MCRGTVSEESMSISPKATDVFGTSITEHLEVVRQLEAQQPILEAIARAIHSTCRQNWWAAFSTNVAAWPRWR